MRIVSVSAGFPELREGMVVAVDFIGCLLACVVGRHARSKPCDRVCDVRSPTFFSTRLPSPPSAHTRRHTPRRWSRLIVKHPHEDPGGLRMTVITDTIRNGVDTENLFGTLDLIRAQPELAKFQFRATNRWIDGAHNRSTIRDFYAAGGEDTSRGEAFVIDAGEPAILLGTDTGANPVEYLLHALAACLTTSIVYVAAARKVELTSVES